METSEAAKRALTSPSRRLEAVPTYMFAELERRVAEKRQAGVDVISLGIGDPDRGTYPHIVQAMQADPSQYREEEADRMIVALHQSGLIQSVQGPHSKVWIR